MSDSIVTVTNLSYSYDGSNKVLNDINFQVDPGESLGILGPNGGGKSTLLKILVGLLEVQTGEIEVMGGAGYVPQFTRLNDLLTLVYAMNATSWPFFTDNH